jgi:hypothetical protein
MTKKSSIDSIKKLSEAIEGEIVFVPHPHMRKAKATLIVALQENPITDLESITSTQAIQITGENRLSKWWSIPGFKAWFINKEEYRYRLEYLFDLALDTAEEILVDRDANTNAKVQMIKVLAELSNKMPQKWKHERFLDAEIQKMDKAQLESFLSKQGVKLVGGQDGENNS